MFHTIIVDLITPVASARLGRFIMFSASFFSPKAWIFHIQYSIASRASDIFATNKVQKYFGSYAKKIGLSIPKNCPKSTVEPEIGSPIRQE